MKQLILVLCLVLIAQSQVVLRRRHPRNYEFTNGDGNFTLTNDDDFLYYAPEAMGTPPQTGLNMIFDTTSNQLWIDTLNGHYINTSSSTCNVTTKTRNLSYYPVGEVDGFLGTEVFSSPVLNISVTVSTLFANAVSGMQQSIDGLVALGYADDLNVMDLAVQKYQLSDAIFAFDLRNQDQVTYFYAGSKCFPATEQISKLRWLDVHGTLYGHYWAVEIEKTSIKGTTKDQEWDAKKAIIDSGSSFVTMGSWAYDTIINIVAPSSKNNTLCAYNNQSEVYICKCSASQMASYPPITFIGKGGLNLPIVPEDYLIPLGASTCALALSKLSWTIPMMWFGDAFMRNYFVAYDKAHSQVGFSQPDNPGTVKENKFLFIKN